MTLNQDNFVGSEIRKKYGIECHMRLTDIFKDYFVLVSV